MQQEPLLSPRGIQSEQGQSQCGPLPGAADSSGVGEAQGARTEVGGPVGLSLQIVPAIQSPVTALALCGEQQGGVDTVVQEERTEEEEEGRGAQVRNGSFQEFLEGSLVSSSVRNGTQGFHPELRSPLFLLFLFACSFVYFLVLFVCLVPEIELMTSHLPGKGLCR